MIYNSNAYLTVQEAINKANSDGGGVVHVMPGTYEEKLTLYDNITLVGENGLSIIKCPAGTNEDCIIGTNLDKVRIIGIEVNGNKANQTGTGLSGDDITIKGRGIYLSGCTKSEISNCYVHDCRLHGILIYSGSENLIRNVTSNCNGSLESTRYGNGLMIKDSPRCRVRDFIGSDNDANSGLSIVGALGVGCDLSGINCERNNASNITINSPYCRMNNFYSNGAIGSSGCGLNIGHNSSSDLYADYCVVSNGQIVNNTITGLAICACVGGVFDNIVSKDNNKHNLIISCTDVLQNYHAHNISFNNCIFDTTIEVGDIPIGDNILITSLSKVDATIGDYYFTNCQTLNALRYGIRVSGASRVRWIGGCMQNNKSGGITSETNGQVPIDIVASDYVFVAAP